MLRYDMSRLVACLVSILLLATVAARAEIRFEPNDVVELLSRDDRFALPIEVDRDALIDFYSAEDAETLFLGTRRAPDLIWRMTDAAYDGLESRDYPIAFLTGLLAEADGAPGLEQAEIELWFAAHFLGFARDMKVGRVVPRKLYPDMYVPVREISGAPVLRAVTNFADLDDFFAAWEPFNPEYRRLRGVLSDYLQLAEIGGWPSVGSGDPLGPGDNDPRVSTIRQRLLVEGLLADGASEDSTTYDEALAEDVRGFQRRYRLAETGTIDTKTMLAMNVPIDTRVRQIALAMERLRWLPEVLSGTWVYVNRGTGVLSVMRDEAVVWTLEAAINCPRGNGIVAADTIRLMAVNPFWTVPADYFTLHLLPRLRQEAESLAAEGFELIEAGVRQPIQAYPWDQIGDAELRRASDRFLIRQRPGPTNPYGRIVYRMHEDSRIELFDLKPSEGDRTDCDPRLGLGAIGVSDGVTLSTYLINERIWPASAVEREIESGASVTYPSTVSVPVVVTHLSATIGADNEIQFSSDVNFDDARLIEALAGRKRSF